AGGALRAVVLHGAPSADRAAAEAGGGILRGRAAPAAVRAGRVLAEAAPDDAEAPRDQRREHPRSGPMGSPPAPRVARMVRPVGGDPVGGEAGGPAEAHGVVASSRQTAEVVQGRSRVGRGWLCSLV